MRKKKLLAIALSATLCGTTAVTPPRLTAYADSGALEKDEADADQEKKADKASPSDADRKGETSKPDTGDEKEDKEQPEDEGLEKEIEETGKTEEGKEAIPQRDTATMSNALKVSAEIQAPTEEDGFEIEDGRLISYTGEETDIAIPDGVTEIGSNAFASNTKLRSVAIPASVETIGEDAFRSCTDLEEVTFEDGSALKTIGKGAFSSLGRKFGKIMIPAEVATLGTTGADVFTGSSGLKDIEVEDGSEQFYSYDGVVYKTDGDIAWFVAPGKTGTVTIKDGTTRIGSRAFEKSGVTFVNLPDSLTAIEDKAFLSSKLIAIEIPGSVEKIGAQAFYNNTKLVTATIGDGVREIGNSAFETCYSLIGLRFPASVEKVGSNAAADNGSAFQAVRVDGADTAFESEPVDYYIAIRIVGKEGSRIQETIEALNAEKGDGSKLQFISEEDYVEAEDVTPAVTAKALDIAETYELSASVSPENATAPGLAWYSTDTDVATATFDKKTGKTTIEGISEGEADIVAATVDGASAVIHVTVGWGEDQTAVQVDPDGTVTGYIGSEDTVDIPEEINGIKVTAIADGAFQGRDVTAVTLPVTLKKIGNNAFKGCVHLAECVIPNGVEEIGGSAFSDTSLTEVVIPETVKTVDAGAFSSIEVLTRAEIRADLAELADNMFQDDYILSEVILPDTIEKIGVSAFDGCRGLTTVNFPKELLVLSERAFSGCGKLGAAVLPDKVTDIHSKAFYNCSGLKEISVPAATTNIGDGIIRNIFEDKETDPGAKSLVDFHVAEGNPVYESEDGLVYGTDGSFLFCPRARTELTVREGTTRIGDYACFICFELKKIVLPSTLKEVGANAFHYCEGVTELTLPDGLETVLDSAFFGLEAWENVVIPESVTRIERYGFAECGASVIRVPENVTRIEMGAFWGYEGTLEQLILPDTLTYIGDSAFSWGKKVPNVYIPEKVEYIGAEAFGRFDSLSWVTVPDAVREIGRRCFIGNASMKGIFIPAGTKLGEEVLRNVPSDLIIFSDQKGTEAEAYAKEAGHRFVLFEKTGAFDGDVLIEDIQNVVAGDPDIDSVTADLEDASEDPIVKNALAGTAADKVGAAFTLSMGTTTEKEKGGRQQLNGELTLSVRIPDAFLSDGIAPVLYEITEEGKTAVPARIIGSRMFAKAQANGTYALLSDPIGDAGVEPDGGTGGGTGTDDGGKDDHTRPSGGHSSSGSSVRTSASVTARSKETWKEDAQGWWLELPDGSYPKDSWYEAEWQGEKNWYQFDANGYLRSGWFTDQDGETYYLHDLHDGRFGGMYTGWHWIGGRCYYFNSTERNDGEKRGSLVRNAVTPDGYTVNDRGVWTIDGIEQVRE